MGELNDQWVAGLQIELSNAYYQRDAARRERYTALVELESFRKDAERYRLLRMAHWWESSLCVVRDPKRQVKPGTDCPSGDRLDEAVDALKAAEARNG